ncbi:MAG: helix-turn-helix domain-containing protein [Bacteroidales bacterium]|nr:helix-turn-helix domain-containing protein [Bacteroidales bacterium]
MDKKHTHPDDFIFTDDLHDCGSPQFCFYCLHLVCLGGSASFKLGHKVYQVGKDDVIIRSSAQPMKDIVCDADFRMKGVIISRHYLNVTTPNSAYRVTGMISTILNPVFHVSDADVQRCLRDIDEIYQRYLCTEHLFSAEILKRLVQVMVFDFYDMHQRSTGKDLEHSGQAGIILRQFINLIHNGGCRTNRTVEYYADKLCITPNYLNEVCHKVSDYNALAWINLFTSLEIAQQLEDKSIPLNQIADEFNFSSPAYFSRYVKRLLGVTPSEFRKQIS